MSESSANPYAAPATVEPAPRSLFRGAIADIRWNDRDAALRTGLRLLLVAMPVIWLVYRAFEIRDLGTLFGGSGTLSRVIWWPLSRLSLVMSGVMLVGTVLLFRGSPHARRKVGLGCLLFCALTLAKEFASWFTDYTLYWETWLWTVAGFVLAMLRLVWLRRLAATQPTRKLATFALRMHGSYAVVGSAAWLVCQWQPQLVASLSGLLAIVWTLFPAAVHCIDILVVARVLGEYAGSEASENSSALSAQTV